MNDIKTRALEYLEAHQEVKEIFATKDGFLFEKKYDNTITLKIDGMMCGHCEAHVSDALRKVEGVEKVTASHTKKTAIVQSNKQLDKELLKKAVDDKGYTVVEII